MSEERLFPEERRQKILEILEDRPKILVSELSDTFHVSQFTVRGDLDELERLGLLKRTHGGAVRIEAAAFTSSNLSDFDASKDYLDHIALMSREKAAIGAKAASLVSPGDIVAVDTGTTTIELIRHLSQDIAVTILTNDFRICSLAESHLRNAELLFLGGFVRMGHHYTEGSQVTSALKHYHVDKAFLSASGFTVDEGFMSGKPNQAQIKRGYLTSAKESYIMMDTSKLGRVSFAQFAATSEVDGIITNSLPKDELIEAIHAVNEKLEIIDAHTTLRE